MFRFVSTVRSARPRSSSGVQSGRLCFHSGKYLLVGRVIESEFAAVAAFGDIEIRDMHGDKSAFVKSLGLVADGRRPHFFAAASRTKPGKGSARGGLASIRLRIRHL